MNNRKMKDKVYIILYDHEDGTSIDSIFYDEELAKIYFEDKGYIDHEHFHYYIEEHDVTTDIETKEKKYYILMNQLGILQECSIEDTKDKEEAYDVVINSYNGELELRGIFIAMSRKEAIEKANKKRVELIKNNEWCYREKIITDL